MLVDGVIVNVVFYVEETGVSLLLITKYSSADWTFLNIVISKCKATCY